MMNKENVFDKSVMECRASVLTQHYLQELKEEFNNIEVDDNKNITEEFYKFGVGTNKTDIINWFNQRVNIREEK